MQCRVRASLPEAPQLLEATLWLFGQCLLGGDSLKGKRGCRTPSLLQH